MKTLAEIYRPYNYSSAKIHIAETIIEKAGMTKVEHKLPLHIGKVKGIYVTSNIDTGSILTGKRVTANLSLSFNTGIIKAVQIPVMNTRVLNDCSFPLPLNEEILPGSLIQGLFYDIGMTEFFPYTVKIYLHYEPRDCKESK